MDRYDLYAFIIALTLAFLIGLIMGHGTLGIALVTGLTTYIGIIDYWNTSNEVYTTTMG